MFGVGITGRFSAMVEPVEQPSANNASSRKANLSFPIAAAIVVFAIIILWVLSNLPKSAVTSSRRNEISAIQNVQFYIQAQNNYARDHRSKSGQLLFARTLRTLAETDALIDGEFAHAEVVGPEPATAKAGYLYKTLTVQGPHVDGGKKSYINGDGEMTLGFALIAYPVAYSATGRLTFMAGSDGIVYCKDLGSETEKIVSKITEFDPDETWIRDN